MSKTYKIIVIFAVFIFLFYAEGAAQCAMCKASAESSLKHNPNSMARSLNSGILYLMAVPYLLIMFIFRKQLYQLYKKVFKKDKLVAED
jgi:hypothetical protein